MGTELLVCFFFVFHFLFKWKYLEKTSSDISDIFPLFWLPNPDPGAKIKLMRIRNTVSLPFMSKPEREREREIEREREGERERKLVPRA